MFAVVILFAGLRTYYSLSEDVHEFLRERNTFASGDGHSRGSYLRRWALSPLRLTQHVCSQFGFGQWPNAHEGGT